MIIENKTENVQGVRSDKGMVLTLMPGGNRVNEEIYKTVKSEIDFLEKAGKVKVYKSEKDVIKTTASGKETKTKEETTNISIKDLNATEAEKLIAQTVDMPTLKAWKAEEPRDSVRLAIQTQIDLIVKGDNLPKTGV